MSWTLQEHRCFEQEPNCGFVCTKMKDHEGPHVAMGGQSTEPLATWPNKAPKVHVQAREVA